MSSPPRAGSGPTDGRSPRWQWFRAWAPAVLWMILIFGASSFRRPPVLVGELVDLRAHLVVYAVLGALVARAWSPASGGRVRLGRAALAAGIAAIYGATDEAHQAFVPGRVASIADLGADAAGAAAGAGAVWAWGIVSTMIASSRAVRHRSKDSS